MQEILRVNLIWCGLSDATCWNNVEHAILRKTIALTAFFRRYKVLVTLWTDGDFPSRNRCALQAKLGVDTVSIKSVFELFSRIENDASIDNTMHKRVLRYLFSYELGCIAPYERGASSQLIDSYKPVPAIAADIVKLLLGYLEPGLFLDIGLSVTMPINTAKGYVEGKDFEESVYKYLSPDRKFIYPFAFARMDNFSSDVQILYSSDHADSKQLYKKLIEAFTAPELTFSDEKKRNDVKTYVNEPLMGATRTKYMRTYSWHDRLPISDTVRIINYIINMRDGVFGHFLLEKENRITLCVPRDGCFLSKGAGYNSFAGLAYKTRGESFIDDYKKISSNEDLRKALIKKISILEGLCS
jgi:hypothetical protein